MFEINFSFIVASFFAGLLTFLAPCTLPIIPAYLGFISGVNRKELENPALAKTARRKIFFNGLAFIAGFSFIFILLGVFAGFAGAALAPYRLWLTRLGGILVILFGLFLLGLFQIPLFQSEKRIPIPHWLTLGKPFSSFFIGGTFALGWTPCVGPILGSILFLAGSSGTILEGGVLLAIFSFGFSLPFLFVAALFSKATTYIQTISKYLQGISILGGIFLILLGILLLTDNFGLIIQSGYELFDFINYEKILNYL